MFNMNPIYEIRRVVDKAVDAAGTKEWQELSVSSEHVFERKGIVLCLDLRMHTPSFTKHKQILLKLIVFGNRFAFVCTSDHYNLFYEDVHAAKFLSSHDECWIYSVESYINSIYFSLANELDATLRPIDMYATCDILSQKDVIANYTRETDVNGDPSYNLVKVTQVK